MVWCVAAVEDLDDEDLNKSSLIASAINLSNTILGAGVLAMPYVCSQLGIAFFAVCCCTDLSALT